MKAKLKDWLQKGTPWIWFNAGAVAISIIMVIGLLLLLIARGMVHFWPSDVMEATYSPPTNSDNSNSTQIIGEIIETEIVLTTQIVSSGIPVESDKTMLERDLIKSGNRDVTGADFNWILTDYVSLKEYPKNMVTLERKEWGNLYGYLSAIKENDAVVRQTSINDDNYDEVWEEFGTRLERALAMSAEISEIEKNDIGQINYRMERLRLEERKLELEGLNSGQSIAEIDANREIADSDYQSLQGRLMELYERASRDSVAFQIANNQQIEIEMSEIVRAYRPNDMGVVAKLATYGDKVWEFLADEPREANTEGGIFPAIFGTVMMVMLMSIFVTPFGVMAAVYLREYAKQGFATRVTRIAVNNLAGVPSIVFGVFGLGFFIYIMGGEIDQLFYPEALPAPTFGTPGLLWASLTLALLTLPVVIVATEEGLARIPRSVREGSLALGATKFETLWRVVLPMASPAMMTGLILAVARAAGEVAPLMLVGVVKLAPSLPLDGNYPYLHLEQKFMHLGFHIYDVGFQSPNIEAARPLVFATALLLVILIALLNLAAVALRNNLREKYKTLDV